MPRLLGDVIAQDDDMIGLDLVKTGSGGDALARQIHVGQRAQQHHLVAVHLGDAYSPCHFALLMLVPQRPAR